VTRAEIRQVIERYVAGERPADIAAALELDPVEVATMCAGPTSVGQVAKALTPKAKRPRKAREDAHVRAAAPTSADEFDPAGDQAQHKGGASQRNHGFGYASIRGGGRRWL
jgi:hypothetical protein